MDERSREEQNRLLYVAMTRAGRGQRDLPDVWLLGRIYCTGTPQDYAAVHALQDQCKLVPLSSWGKDYTPPPGKVDPSIDMKTAVRDQVNRMSAVEYFTLLAELMKTNPPAAADAPAPVSSGAES